MERTNFVSSIVTLLVIIASAFAVWFLLSENIERSNAVIQERLEKLDVVISEIDSLSVATEQNHIETMKKLNKILDEVD